MDEINADLIASALTDLSILKETILSLQAQMTIAVKKTEDLQHRLLHSLEANR